MRLFFSEIPFTHNSELILSENESKHLCKVLRMKIGDEIKLLDGQGSVAKCEIVDNNYKKTKVIVRDLVKHLPDPYRIHIAIAPTKNNDRIDWFVEKATELGVHQISFIHCENNEKAKIKLDRLNRIAISAMKQSKRFFKPIIKDIVKLTDFVEKHQGGFIAHCYENDQKIAVNEELFQAEKENIIIIGPEGDFSVNEIKIVKEFNYKALTLGKTRLRTETAGLYACMLMKHYLE